ncbi:unnamed protein product [Ixodes pacificus]
MSASHSSNQGGPGGRGSYNKGNSFTPRCCFAFYYILRIRASLRASSFQEVSKLFFFFLLLALFIVYLRCGVIFFAAFPFFCSLVCCEALSRLVVDKVCSRAVTLPLFQSFGPCGVQCKC